MGLNGINLIVGIVTGIVLSSIVWGVVISLRSNKNKKNSERSNELIVSIADLLADIENMSRLYTSNKISKAEFTKSFESKYESVNRFVKSGMHMLDIYFVKYVELFLEQINKSLEEQKSVSEEPKAAATPFVQSSIKEVVEEKEPEIEESFDDEFVSEAQDTSSEEQYGDAPNADTKTENVVVKIEEVVEELPETKNAVEAEPELSDDELDLDSFEANIPEEFIEEKNQEQNDVDFAEEMVSEHKNVFDTDSAFDGNQDKGFIDNGFGQEEEIVDVNNGTDFNDSADQSEILTDESGFEQSQQSSDEEDFSMETLVDYDVDKVKNLAFGDANQEKADDSDSLKSNYPEEEEILCETIQFDTSSIHGRNIDNDETGHPPKVSDIEKDSFAKKQSESLENSQGDVAITGDDVASQIDSFFGFKE